MIHEEPWKDFAVAWCNYIIDRCLTDLVAFCEIQTSPQQHRPVERCLFTRTMGRGRSTVSLSQLHSDKRNMILDDAARTTYASTHAIELVGNDALDPNWSMFWSMEWSSLVYMPNAALSMVVADPSAPT